MENWFFTSNVFETSTRNSYHNALKIAIYHDLSLFAVLSDPFFGPIYAYFHPICESYELAFNNWDKKWDEQQGKTRALENLLKQLSISKIKQWAIKILNEYAQNTPEYKHLLPNGRDPFRNGTQVRIITEVKNLGEKLADYPALAATKTDVDNFYTTIQAAYDAQKKAMSQVDALGKILEIERLNMCDAQYSDLGQLMSHFHKTPTSICSYFDLKTIRSTHQVYFTGHINPLDTKQICKHTFHAGDKVKICNTGDTQLKFYISLKNGKLPSTAYTIVPHTEQKIEATLLGDITKFKYIYVYNPDELVAGSYTFELL